MLQRSSRNVPEEQLQSYYRELKSYSVEPLWLAQAEVQATEPKSKAVPYLWRWRELRPQALRAGELVGTEQAERRVLRLLNPGLEGRTATTTTLFAGLQIVLPGEFARAHRHTLAALRFIIESDGGYTVVNGECIPMHPGDLVLTPNWTWHDHGNDTRQPMIWLDGLDIPLVRFLDATFYESYPEDVQPVTEPVEASVARYGSAVLQPAGEKPAAPYSPLWRYPWEQTRSALERLAALEAGSPYDGVLMDYTNPITGRWVMPTISCHIQLLRPGERTKAHRHTVSAVYHVVEGRGLSIVDRQKLEWEGKDVFCVPGWAFHEHENRSATEPAILFSYTDAPVLRTLDLYREQAHPRGSQLGS
jgi:gentisate 1,2-dioxygenase